MLLIGIIIGGATFTMRTGSVPEVEAKRLAALIDLAQEEAILNSAEFALVFRHGGYMFYTAEDAEWQPSSAESIFRELQFPASIELLLYLDGEEARVWTSDFGLQGEEGQPPKPALYLFSSGEFTPFEIVLRDTASKAEYRLSGDPFAGVSVKSREL
jgi:general secretion pathway protein H